jgi:hypothetical protein
MNSPPTSSKSQPVFEGPSGQKAITFMTTNQHQLAALSPVGEARLTARDWCHSDGTVAANDQQLEVARMLIVRLLRSQLRVDPKTKSLVFVAEIRVSRLTQILLPKTCPETHRLESRRLIEPPVEDDSLSSLTHDSRTCSNLLKKNSVCTMLWIPLPSLPMVIISPDLNGQAIDVLKVQIEASLAVTPCAERAIVAASI